jgi:hypothetical protein
LYFITKMKKSAMSAWAGSGEFTPFAMKTGFGTTLDKRRAG